MGIIPLKDAGEEAIKQSLWRDHLRVDGRLEQAHGFEDAPGVGRVFEDRAKAASPLKLVPAREFTFLLRFEEIDLGIEDVSPIGYADFVPRPVQPRQVRNRRLPIKLPQASTRVKQALSEKVSVTALPHETGQIPLRSSALVAGKFHRADADVGDVQLSLSDGVLRPKRKTRKYGLHNIIHRQSPREAEPLRRWFEPNRAHRLEFVSSNLTMSGRREAYDCETVCALPRAENKAVHKHCNGYLGTC